MSTNDSKDSLWTFPALRRLVVLSFFGFSGFSLTLASLPLWAVSGGAGAAAAGLVTTTMLAVTVGVQVLIPALVRRFGVARILVAGLLLLGGPSPLLLLSRALWWLSLISGVRGVGFAVITVLGADLTARIAPRERHGEAIGIYGLSIALPNLLAVPGGVALTVDGHFPIVAWLAALPVLAAPVAWPLARALTPAAARAHRRPGRATLFAVMSPAVVLLVLTLAGGGLLTFLPIERPTGQLASATLLVFGAAGAASRWGAGWLADRIGSRVLLPAALALAAIGLCGVSVGLTAGGGATLVVVSAAVFGSGFGATQNLTLLICFARAGMSGSTSASAIWNAAFDTGTGIGALGVGAVAALGPGLPWTYVGCALLIVATIPLGAAVSRAIAVRSPANGRDPDG